MESIDDLLAQVKAEYQKPENQQPQQKSLIEELKSLESSTVQSNFFNQEIKSFVEEGLLAEVKAEFEEKQREEAIKKQQQQREEQRRQKEQRAKDEQIRLQQQQQRKEALTKEATEWLKNLNFRSEEGLWFEEFSYSYPSKLEAAIDYLQALKETNP